MRPLRTRRLRSRSPGRRPLQLALAVALALTACASTPDAPPEGAEVLELVPEEAPSWSMTNVLAPVTGLLLGGPGYWYDPRTLDVETTPPGAVLDLFYVRRNFQKRYEQADAPVRLVLPSRIEATPRDSVTIRALLPGYRQREVHVKVRDRDEQVMIDLEPLPNSLVAFRHGSFAGRGSLEFVTTEALTFRVQESRKGFQVVLTETAITPDATRMFEGVESALVASAGALQLGEDLVVEVALTERGSADAMQLRSRQSADPVRDLHTFALDLVPRDGGAADVERARAALERIGPRHASGCALEFDTALRDALDPADLARALAPSGAYTDKYLRAAMKRLGEISPGGRIRMTDGTEFRVDAPIELMAAATRAEDAVGYLAVLRTFVAELQPEGHRSASLRGLIAPDVAPERFAGLLERARAREQACRAGGG